jgi:hypothetical protein
MFSFTKMSQTISGSGNAWNVARVRPQYAAFFSTAGGVFDETYAEASYGLYIHPENSNVYVCGESNVFRVSVRGNLVTDAFQNISSSGYTQAANVAATVVSPRAIFFRPEGNSVFVLDGQRQRIQQYRVSSNFTYTGLTSTFVSGNVLANQSGLHFNNDGTKVFVISNDSNVRQYSLNVAWTANSINIASNIAFSVSAQANSGGKSVTFNNDGTKMYIGVSGAERKVYQYSLSSPWDISTTTYSNVAFSTQSPISIDGRNTSPSAIAFSSDGASFVMLDAISPYPVIKWNLRTAWDLSTAYYYNPSYVSLTDLPYPFSTPSAFFITPDGTNVFFLSSSGSDRVVQYKFSQPWYFSSNVTLVGSGSLNTGIYSYGAIAMYVREDIARLYVSSVDDNVYQYSITTPGNISSTTYSQRDVPSNGDSLYSIWFKPDGTKEYVIDVVNDQIKQFNLSSSWNVSSAGSLVGSRTYGGTVAGSLQTSSNGTYFYLTTNNPSSTSGNRFSYDYIQTYTTNTAWELANVTSGAVSPLHVGAFSSTSNFYFYWNPSGTQFYSYMTGFSSATNAVTFVTYSIY